MADKLLYVTGGNARYFALVCAVFQSFKSNNPGGEFVVCDFGFTDRQRNLLRALGLLMELPRGLPPGLHPFYYKACLGRYVKARDFDTLVWLDGDVIVLRNLDAALREELAILAGTRGAVAICPNSSDRDVGDFVRKYPHALPFRAALEAQGTPLSVPYYNTGVFAVRSRELLSDWETAVFAVKPHTLFEQNMFNVVVHRPHVAVRPLDAGMWNVHGSDLAELAAPPRGSSDSRLLLRGRCPFIVHATAPQPSLVDERQFSIGVGKGRAFKGLFRFIKNEAVGAVQRSVIAAFVTNHAVKLERHGLMDCDVRGAA